VRIAFLGLGKMGQPMVRRLLAAGHSVTVWNRTAARCAALAALGAKVAPTPAEAVCNCDAVLSMLFDDAAYEQYFFGPDSLLPAFSPGALHIVFATISVALSTRLTAEHQNHGIALLAAPVFGRPAVAEAGRLWIVAAGAVDAVERARPIFETLSRGLTILGIQPPQAHALKLGGNFLISAMIRSLGESFVYARSQRIQPEIFLSTVNAALFQSPFYEAYGSIMLNPPTEPGATVELGLKDINLLRQAAASAGTTLSLAEELREIFIEAIADGLAQADWAVGQYRIAEKHGIKCDRVASDPGPLESKR